MSLLRASLTLALGNALAQLLPLLLGPWIARLYTPAEFAEYSLVWAVASNLAVVACARYEMALPLAAGASSTRALLALCLRLLALLWGLSALIGWLLQSRWPAMVLLPALVLLMGGVQLLGMLATREQRFGLLAVSRVWQWGLAAVLQVLAGLQRWGAWGLLLAALGALTLALLWLLLPLRRAFRGWRRVSQARLKVVAQRYKDFPLLNTPHAFAGAAQDTLTLLLISAVAGDVATGLWALALRYLKAPATLIGAALSSALYPQLTQASTFEAARAQVRRCIRSLLLMSLPFALLLLFAGPALFAWAFGEPWRGAGELARALSPYLALHFVASPLAVVTMAWGAQAWALRLALVGQALFLVSLAVGLQLGGLVGAGWAVSASMLLYFGYYLLALWRWRA
jgi:O-antigen/teichoic acid export membrane protein